MSVPSRRSGEPVWGGFATPGRQARGLAPDLDAPPYHALVEQVPAVVYVDTLDGPASTIYISPSVEEILGYSVEEWLADPDLWERLLHPMDRGREVAASLRHHETGEPYRSEYRMHSRDGSLHWIRDEAVVVGDDDGTPRFCQGVMYDVTELIGATIQRERRVAEAAEQALNESEAKYRTLVEQIPAITYTAEFGDDGTWYYVSPQIEAILGFTQGEWTAEGNLWLQRLHPDDRERILEEERRSQLSGEPVVSEYRFLARDGRIVWVRDEAVVVHGHDGAPMLQGVLFDITESKRAAEELQRALELEREASLRLRALDELKNTFLHAVSHELRTPLAAVLGFALTLERIDVEFQPGEREELLHRLAANARKLDQLLSDLLDLDRLDRGIVEPRRRPTDVASLVRRTVENSDVLGLRPVRVDADLVVVGVDAAKVERIVENLLANAARHTPPDTTIWVRVSPAQSGVLIQVEDSGPGVPKELRESIFEPFSQGSLSSDHSPGVGIGLSLVGRFAALHGGQAWVEERPGGGASFRVYLPGAPSEPSAPPERDYFSTGTPTSEPYSVQDPS